MVYLRYYVLKIEDEQSKRHAFIGMGFHERDQSFEFKVGRDVGLVEFIGSGELNCGQAALQDFQRRKANEKRLLTEPQRVLPKLNLTLKEGETIKVNIKTGGSNSFGR